MCFCPGISLESLRTRIWSSEIKARKNKESQNDKQPIRKKSQTKTDSLWSTQDKNQLFKLISHFLHQNKMELTVSLMKPGCPEQEYFSKVSRCSFSDHLYLQSNQIFLALLSRNYSEMRGNVHGLSIKTSPLACPNS
jgi:hypothetical protein